MVLVDIHRGTVLLLSCDGFLDALFPDPCVCHLQIMEFSLAHAARPVVCRRRGRTEAGGGFE